MKTLLALFLILAGQLHAGYLKQITLSVNSPGNLVPSTQTNFPVPIMVGTFSYLKTVGNGGFIQNTTTLNSNTVPADLVFSTTACTSPTLIKWEIAKGYVASTGAIQVWAKIASLGTGVTTIYGCFDNTAITTYQGGTGADVWSVSAYHSEEATDDDMVDSAMNNPMVSAGVGHNTKVTGKIGDALQWQSFRFASVNDGSGTPAPAGLTGGTHAFTQSCWFLSSGASFANGGAFSGLGGGTGSGGTQIVSFYGGSGATQTLLAFTGIPNSRRTDVTYNDSSWHHFVVVNPAGNNSSSSIKLYFDGALATMYDVSANTFSVSLNDLAIAAWPTTHNLQCGTSLDTCQIDEVHFWDSELSADWITTEYNSQNAPGTFTTIAGPTDVGTLIPRRVVLIQ